MEKKIKIVLAILLLMCIINLPYGFYQLVRFLAFIGFSVLAYYEYKRKDDTKMIVYISLALLFQPFFKIALGRTIWNTVDVAIAAYLLYTVYFKTSKNM